MAATTSNYMMAGSAATPHTRFYTSKYIKDGDPQELADLTAACKACTDWNQNKCAAFGQCILRFRAVKPFSVEPPLCTKGRQGELDWGAWFYPDPDTQLELHSVLFLFGVPFADDQMLA